MIYLMCYHPLIESKNGREAMNRFGYPPFVEASCRREPDLEHEFPGLSGLSGGSKFAPKLQVEDKVVCLAAKADYPGFTQPHWRLTAILEVIHRFDNHEAAAEWYRENEQRLPSNCIVDGNEPLELEMTMASCMVSGKRKRPSTVDEWDDQFRAKAKTNPQFLVCKSLFKELRRPPILTERDAQNLFATGSMPSTLTPPVLEDVTFAGIKRACGVRI